MGQKTIEALCGIDFSINSTGVCIQVGDQLRFLNFPRGLLTSKFDGVGFSPFPLAKREKYETYTEGERLKLEDAVYASDEIVKEIKRCGNDMGADRFRVALEGISFGSKGSSFIDIVGYQWILRERIVEELDVFPEVFAPQTVKKAAGSGRFNKDEMREQFFKLDNPVLRNSEFFQWLEPNLGVRGLPVTHDMIDGFFIMCCLKPTDKDI